MYVRTTGERVHRLNTQGLSAKDINSGVIPAWSDVGVFSRQSRKDRIHPRQLNFSRSFAFSLSLSFSFQARARFFDRVISQDIFPPDVYVENYMLTYLRSFLFISRIPAQLTSLCAFHTDRSLAVTRTCEFAADTCPICRVASISRMPLVSIRDGQATDGLQGAISRLWTIVRCRFSSCFSGPAIRPSDNRLTVHRENVGQVEKKITSFFMGSPNFSVYADI